MHFMIKLYQIEIRAIKLITMSKNARDNNLRKTEPKSKPNVT